MINVVRQFKNKIVRAKWLPLVLAISIVFVPNSYLLFKVIGGLLALVLFYNSIISDKNISSRDLLK